jgi:hypothetical protein
MAFVHWTQPCREIMNMRPALSWCEKLESLGFWPIVEADILRRGLNSAWELESAGRMEGRRPIIDGETSNYCACDLCTCFLMWVGEEQSSSDEGRIWDATCWRVGDSRSSQPAARFDPPARGCLVVTDGRGPEKVEEPCMPCGQESVVCAAQIYRKDAPADRMLEKHSHTLVRSPFFAAGRSHPSCIVLPLAEPSYRQETPWRSAPALVWPTVGMSLPTSSGTRNYSTVLFILLFVEVYLSPGFTYRLFPPASPLFSIIPSRSLPPPPVFQYCTLRLSVSPFLSRPINQRASSVLLAAFQLPCSAAFNCCRKGS